MFGIDAVVLGRERFGIMLKATVNFERVSQSPGEPAHERHYAVAASFLCLVYM